jgi:hypothetical protein
MVFQTEMNGRGPGTAVMMLAAQLHRAAPLGWRIRMAIGRAMAFLSSLASAVEQARPPPNEPMSVQDRPHRRRSDESQSMAEHRPFPALEYFSL